VVAGIPFCEVLYCSLCKPCDALLVHCQQQHHALGLVISLDVSAFCHQCEDGNAQGISKCQNIQGVLKM
jgi:hypothetical protein